MASLHSAYIDGVWRTPLSGKLLPVENPATGSAVAEIRLGTEQDLDEAVAAARRAFTSFSLCSPGERRELLNAIRASYEKHSDELASVLVAEVGIPVSLARSAHVPMGARHIETMIQVLETGPLEEMQGSTRILREPIGVVGMITPWNWPVNQIMCKTVAALAAGCTMVLKPSEIAPLNALVMTRILDEAGVPKGIFNLVNGMGDDVGAAMSRHPGIDMISFTGSTRAGILIAREAAYTVKRVSQELGGKSANIILPDADLDRSVGLGVLGCMRNSGQSCGAPTRMLVHESQHEKAAELARAVVAGIVVGDPTAAETTMGPVVSRAQYDRVQRYIEAGIDDGARLVAGGPGKPEGLEHGHFVKPTVFADVTRDMTIAQEEIFGPVLAIIPYADEAEAVAIANDTVYGLAAFVQSADQERARAVARRLRSGSVQLNYPAWDPAAPFGGYKQSGNGREYARFGLEDFTEVKAVIGW